MLYPESTGVETLTSTEKATFNFKNRAMWFEKSMRTDTSIEGSRIFKRQIPNVTAKYIDFLKATKQGKMTHFFTLLPKPYNKIGNG